MKLEDQAPAENRKPFSIRTTIVLLVAVLTAIGAIALSLLAGRNIAEACLVSAGAFGCTLALAHKLIE